MGMRRSAGIPAPLENVRLRFERWRRSRTGRQRIPETLWAAAVDLARDYGVHRTAKTLRLDYYRLRKRVTLQNTPAATDRSPMAAANGATHLLLTGLAGNCRISSIRLIVCWEVRHATAGSSGAI